MKPFEIELGGRTVRLSLDEAAGMARIEGLEAQAEHRGNPTPGEEAGLDAHTIDFSWESETEGAGQRMLHGSNGGPSSGPFLLRVGLKTHRVDLISVDHGKVRFVMDGRSFETTVSDSRDLLLRKLGLNSTSTQSSGALQAPMPGKVLDLLVQPGDDVSAEQPVAILEAMKMENELKAPVEGTVKAIHVAVGQSVEKNQLVMEIDPRG